MLDQDTKQAAVKQWDSQWNPPTPKSKWTGHKLRPSPVIAFIPEMDEGQFQQLKADIRAAATQKTLEKFGKILARKNKATDRWEIWDGRSRYLAFASLGLKPPFQFIGGDYSDRTLLIEAIKANAEYRAWASADELQAFLRLASAAMVNLANKDRISIP